MAEAQLLYDAYHQAKHCWADSAYYHYLSSLRGKASLARANTPRSST